MLDAWGGLYEQVTQLPEPARAMAVAGLRKVVDFMDAGYGRNIWTYCRNSSHRITLTRLRADHGGREIHRQCNGL